MKPWIDVDLRRVVRVNLERAIGQCRADVGDRGIHEIRRRHPLALRIDRGGVDPRHVEDVLKQPRQPIQLLQRELRLDAAILRRTGGHPADSSTATRTAVTGVRRSWLNDASSAEARSAR